MHVNRVILGLVALVSAGSVAPGAGAATPVRLVNISVPSGQPASGLLTQFFVQVATCQKACDLTTTVSVALADARRLGYRGSAHGKGGVEVASSYIRLKARTRTEVRFVASAIGKKLLRNAKPGLRVIGRVVAIPSSDPEAAVRTSWTTRLR